MIESLEFTHRSVAVSTFETKVGRGGRAHGKVMKVVTSAVQKLEDVNVSNDHSKVVWINLKGQTSSVFVCSYFLPVFRSVSLSSFNLKPSLCLDSFRVKTE